MVRRAGTSYLCLLMALRMAVVCVIPLGFTVGFLVAGVGL